MLLPRNRWVSYAFLRWFLLVLLVCSAACQPSPPPTGSQSVARPAVNASSLKVARLPSRPNLLPQSTLAFGGDTLPQALAAAYPELATGFQTLAYPATRQGYHLPGISDYQGSVSYGGSPVSHPWNSVGKTSPTPTDSPLVDYAGLVVEEYARNAEGFSFARKIKLHHNISRHAPQGASTPNTQLHYSMVLSFVSDDGVTFTFDGSAQNVGSISYSHMYDYFTDEGCFLKSMGGGDNLRLSSSSLKLDLDAKKAEVNLSFSFGGTVQGTECSAHSEKFLRSASGNLSISYSQEIPVHEEPSIQLVANGSISEGSQTTTIQGIPSDLTASWQTQPTSPYWGCQQGLTGTPYKGEKTFNFPVNRAVLTNGTYTYTPRYTSAVAGQVAGQRYRYTPASVTVNIPTTVTPVPAYLVVGQSTQLQISVPPCPKWTLTLTGPLAGGTEGQTCTYTTAGASSNNAPKNINWNGSCTGGTMGVGTAQGKLTFEGGHIPPVDFSVPIMATVPTPTPTETATPTPTDPPCDLFTGNCDPCLGGLGPGCPTPGPTFTPSAQPTPTPIVIDCSTNPEACGPEDPDDPGCTGSCPTPPPPPRYTPPPPTRTPKPKPTQSPHEQEGCFVGEPQKVAQEASNGLRILSTEALNDTRTFNQLQHRANVLQNRLNEGGFSTQALKPERVAALQAEWAQIEQRLSELYFDIHDDLGYVQDMSNKLAQVIQSRGLPLPPLPMGEPNTLIAQLDARFQSARSDFDAIEEVAILYQETLLFQALTKAYVNQSRASKPTLQALRQLNTKIKQHSNYLTNNQNLLVTPDPETLSSHNAELRELSAELESIVQELQGFGIQSQGDSDLIATVRALQARLQQVESAKTVEQRVNLIRDTRKFIEQESLHNQRQFIELVVFESIPAGKARKQLTKVAIRIFFKTSVQTLQLYTEGKCPQSMRDRLTQLSQQMGLAHQKVDLIVRKIISPDCTDNADIKVLQEILKRLFNENTSSLQVLERLFNQLINAAKQNGSIDNNSPFDQKLTDLERVLNHFLTTLDGYIDTLEEECKEQSCMAKARNMFVRKKQPILLTPTTRDDCIVYRSSTFDNVKTWIPRPGNDTNPQNKPGLSTFDNINFLKKGNKAQVLNLRFLENSLGAFYNGDNGHVSIIPITNQQPDIHKLLQWAETLHQDVITKTLSHPYSISVKQTRTGEVKK